MEPVTKVVLAVVRAIFSPVRSLFMKRRAEMDAAKLPEKFRSIEQSSFDHVLGRIAAADPDDSIFKLVADAATNNFFTPEFLRTMSVQAWLAEPEVRRGLSSLAWASLVGSPEPADVRSDVEARYRTAAMANAQESEAVVNSVVAMFAAGVKASVSDPGTAVLVAGVAQEVQLGFANLNAKLDRGVVRVPALAEHDALKPLDDLTAKAWRDAFSKASTALKRWPTTVGDGSSAGRMSGDGGKVLSEGQRNTALLSLILAAGNGPIVIDQPEDELDSNYIFSDLVPLLRRTKNERQLILATHNANLPVNADAELIYAFDAHEGKGQMRAEGGLDRSAVTLAVLDIMEGSERAFKQRSEKYHF